MLTFLFSHRPILAFSRLFALLSPSHLPTFFRNAGTRRLLIGILILGLLLRLALLLFFWDQPLTIVDEQHYQALAENVLRHGEFSLQTGKPTAIRPPLYPFFLGGIYALTGGVHFNAARIVQIFLNLGIIWMCFLLGRRVFNEKAGLLASVIFAAYPSFLFFTHLLLTEVLFTLFLMLFVHFFFHCVGFGAKSHNSADLGCPPTHVPAFLPSDSRRPSHLLSLLPSMKYRYALLASLFLALGALTRSILYPFAPLAALFLIIFTRHSWVVRAKLAFAFVFTFIVILAPWTLRNYRLFNEFTPVETMGGLNMYMGNYEFTPLNRAWAAVDLTGEEAWYHGHLETLTGMNEAWKQKWASEKAKEFILNNKLLTIKRDLIKAANFWGLERTIIAGVLKNHWPELKNVFCLFVIGLTILTVYVIVVIASLFGMVYNFVEKRRDILFSVILIVYFTGIHAIVFGHSRYHLPLIPLMSIFAAWALLNMRSIYRERYKVRFKMAISLSIVAIGIWVREIFFVEGPQYLNQLFS